jgi:hypothetical protein
MVFTCVYACTSHSDTAFFRMVSPIILWSQRHWYDESGTLLHNATMSRLMLTCERLLCCSPSFSLVTTSSTFLIFRYLCNHHPIHTLTHIHPDINYHHHASHYSTSHSASSTTILHHPSRSFTSHYIHVIKTLAIIISYQAKYTSHTSPTHYTLICLHSFNVLTCIKHIASLRCALTSLHWLLT